MNDLLWKTILETLFEDFLAFFLPDLYPQVDLTKGYTFLDKEFQKLFPSSKKGQRYVDKLVKIYLQDGRSQWILVHACDEQSYINDCKTDKRRILPAVSPAVA